MVGMKCDLVDEKEVSMKDATKFAKNNGAHYFETSAKDGTMVREMFQIIGNTLFMLEELYGFE